MRRPPTVFFLIAVTLLLATSAYFWNSRRAVAENFTFMSGKSKESACRTANIQALIQLDLTDMFEYRRFCMSARRKRGLMRSSISHTSNNFFSEVSGQVIRKDRFEVEDEEGPAACMERLNLDVPFFDSGGKVDTSSLFLGMATTLSRLNESLPHISRWLPHSTSRLQVLVVDEVDLGRVQTQVDELTDTGRRSGMELIFDAYNYSFASDGGKNFGLAETMQKNARAETKWFGIIDDDTFFVSLPSTFGALGSFNPDQSWYIGALTERLSQIDAQGYMAWGGAGFFVSRPLMQTISDHFVECRRNDNGYGDVMWRDCIAEHTSPTIHLTELHGLNQLDMWRDVSGWYEAGHTDLHTLHHWHSWHNHPVPQAHYVTEVAGPESMLQRYAFTDDTVLTNGFSLAHYPLGLPDLNLLELTMSSEVGVEDYPERKEFLHSLGRTRKSMELGREKMQWKFETALMAPDGSVRQFYVRRASNEEGQKVDSVIQIDWRKG